MKKTLHFIFWLIALFLIIILIRTLSLRSLQVRTEPAAIPLFGEKCVEHLSMAVKIPTISYSAGSPVDSVAFREYHTFLNESYPLVNSMLIKKTFNNYSLLYTWKGRTNSLKPVILIAHFDVVPQGESTSWTKPPFSGENDGTFIWGRGTLDDKSEMISILESAEKLLSEGYRPERTIYLVFGHDEEIRGKAGAKTIADSLKQLGVQAEFILDEGMAITNGVVPIIKHDVALIGIAEKGYMSVKLAVEMPGGHSSMPEMESAIIVLNRAVFNLVNKQMKAKISGPVNDFIRYIGPEMPFYARVIFANSWIFKGLLLDIYEGTSSGNALVRTTMAPTIINAGIRDNIIPEKAEAVINFRILPGENSKSVLDHIRKVVSDERIIISPMVEEISEPSPVSSSNAAGFDHISTAIRQVFPGTVVAPTMVMSSSDSRHFLPLSKNVYRFAPITVNNEDMSRLHGSNERIPIADFKKSIGFYYRLIQLSTK